MRSIKKGVVKTTSISRGEITSGNNVTYKTILIYHYDILDMEEVQHISTDTPQSEKIWGHDSWRSNRNFTGRIFSCLQWV